MTPRRGLVAACVAALAVLAGAVVIAVSGMGVDDVKRSTEPDSGAKALRVNSSLALPTTTLTPESEFITDGDVPTDNEPLRAVASTGKGLTIDRYLRVDERRMARLHKTVGVTAPAGTRFDIAHWRQDDDGVLFMMRDLGRTIDLRGIAPTDPVRTIVRRRVPIERAETGTTRYLAIARWSGKLPDLFVIQRGSQLSRVRVTVFSGESGFSRRVLDVRAPLRGITPTGWDVDVGRADGARPDLILVRRGGRSRSPELHVLNGDDRFQSFLMQRTMRLPKGTRSTDRFVFGSSLGFPAVYAIDLSGSGRPKLKHVLLTR